jgi:hypothetical protein
VEDLGIVAEAALAPGSATWKVPVPLSVDILRDSIITADAISRQLD